MTFPISFHCAFRHPKCRLDDWEQPEYETNKSADKIKIGGIQTPTADYLPRLYKVTIDERCAIKRIIELRTNQIDGYTEED